MKTEPIDTMGERIKKLLEITAEDVTAIEANARRNEIIALAAFKKGQSSPKIKRLEWESAYACIKADTPFCKYMVLVIGGKYGLCFDGNMEYLIFDGIDEAKAEAQRDFERRVKECLE